MDEALLILQILPTLHLRHCSFSKPSVCFTYVTANSPTPPSLHLCHSSLSNPSVASPTSPGEPPMDEVLLILQPFRRFTYVTVHSRSLQFASPTSQIILQPFRRFPYVTDHFPTLLSLDLLHRHFTNVSWQAVHTTVINL